MFGIGPPNHDQEGTIQLDILVRARGRKNDSFTEFGFYDTLKLRTHTTATRITDRVEIAHHKPLTFLINFLSTTRENNASFYPQTNNRLQPTARNTCGKHVSTLWLSICHAEAMGFPGQLDALQNMSGHFLPTRLAEYHASAMQPTTRQIPRCLLQC